MICIKNIEKEELNILENQQVSEYLSFDAEDFKTIELYSNNFEEFKVLENKPQSFIDDDKTTKSDDTVSDKKLKDLIKNHINTTTSTSVSTTVPAVMTTVTAAVAVGIGVVALPIDINLIELSRPVEVINYMVDNYYLDLDGDGNLELCNDVIINLKCELDNNKIANIVNLENNESIAVENGTSKVKFKNLKDSKCNFEIQIFENDKLIESYYEDVLVDTNFEFMGELETEYILTYNDDSSTNLYCYLLDDSINDLKTIIDISSSNGELLEYEASINDDILFIEDIDEDHFMADVKSYYFYEGNYYLHSIKSFDIDSNNPTEDISLDLDILNIKPSKEALTDVYVSITHLDDSLVDEFIISKDEFNLKDEISLTLSKTSFNIEINIIGEFNHSSINQNISKYKGSYSSNLNFIDSLNIDLHSGVRIDKVYLLNETYSQSLSNIPTKLEFKGYLEENDYLNVYVYDSLNNLVDYSENITNLNNFVVFDDLDRTQELRIEYVIKNQLNEEKMKDEYLLIYNEINTSEYTFNYVNPVDVFLSFNEDSYNAYFDVEFENNSEYDLYYKIDLIDGISDFYNSKISNDDFIVFEDLTEIYGLNYSVLAKDGINYYAVSDLINLSGTISGNSEEDGYITKYDVNIDDLGGNLFDINLNYRPYSDVNVIATLNDGTVLEFNYALEEVLNNSNVIRLDLSSYTFDNCSLIVKGMFEYNRTSLADKIDIKGITYCNIKFSNSI